MKKLIMVFLMIILSLNILAEQNYFEVNIGRITKSEDKNLLWPVKSTIITSDYGYRNHPVLKKGKMHKGIDIKASIGTDLRASFTGEVTNVSNNNSYGKMIEIQRNDGLKIRYAHLSNINVSSGEKIEMGQIIGQTGNTGRVTGPHLHMEVFENDEITDPKIYSYFRLDNEYFAFDYK